MNVISLTEIEEQLGEYITLTPTQRSILTLLQRKGSLSRKVICQDLQVPWTTVYDNLLKLKKLDLVEKFFRSTGKRGRPIIYWKLKEVFSD